MSGGAVFRGDLPREQKSKHPEKRRCLTEQSEAKPEQLGGIGLRHRGEEIIGAGVDRE